eukprot:Nitzschia sp. Nitz4//scaffold201_size42423//12550//14651//NITZ4_007371-RA/size42423-snap-gene-0.40-mRNA-1//-1//CDS//3329541323//6405//frame0
MGEPPLSTKQEEQQKSNATTLNADLQQTRAASSSPMRVEVTQPRKGRHKRAVTDYGSYTFQKLASEAKGTPTTTNKAGPKKKKKKSHSISGDSLSIRLHVQWGQQELYTFVPFTAVPGLHTKEECVLQAFALYAVHEQGMKNPEHVQQATDNILRQFIDEQPRLTIAFIMAVLLASLGQFNLGYNVGVMNPPAAVVLPGHSTAEWSLAVAGLAIGGPFGSILGGRLADSLGRREALRIVWCIFLAGGAWQTFATSMFDMIGGRFLIGLACGYSTVVVPIYLGELAPPRLRGALGTLSQVSIVLGILVSDLFAFAWATPTQWRFLFAVTPVVSFCQLAMYPWLIESPRWLLHQSKQHALQAKTVLAKLRGYSDSSTQLDQELLNYKVGDAAQSTRRSTIRVVKDLIHNPHTRNILFFTLFLQTAQQFSGINAVFYYSTTFFTGVLENPLVGTTLFGVFDVIATYVAMLLMDRCDRRTLLLASAGGMFLSCLAIIASLQFGWPVTLMVTVTTYVAFFEIGLGPITWLIVAELFDAKDVAIAMSLCSQLNWGCNVLVGYIFPFMNEAWGAYSFVPFATFLVITFWYCWGWENPVEGALTPVEEWIEETNVALNAATTDPHGLGCSTTEIFAAMKQRGHKSPTMVSGSGVVDDSALDQYFAGGADVEATPLLGTV